MTEEDNNNKPYIECRPTTIVYDTEPLGPELIAKLELLEGIPFDAYWDEDKKALMINKGELSRNVNFHSKFQHASGNIGM